MHHAQNLVHLGSYLWCLAMTVMLVCLWAVTLSLTCYFVCWIHHSDWQAKIITFRMVVTCIYDKINTEKKKEWPMRIIYHPLDNGLYTCLWQNQCQIKRQVTFILLELKVSNGDPVILKYEARSMSMSLYKLRNGWVWITKTA